MIKQNHHLKTIIEILLVSTKLGLTSFGGPIAHLGYFHEEYVRRRKWMDEKNYADLVALCQMLPGPASSQVGIGIGITRAGLLGGIVSFIGFTFPSVLALILFATILTEWDAGAAGWIHGLKIVAVVIVAHAVIGMAQKLNPDLKRKAIALLSLIGALLWPNMLTQVGIIIIAAVLGYLFYQHSSPLEEIHESSNPILLSRRFAIVCLALFFGLLIALPILRELTSSIWVAMFDSFYRAGSLVFGGGHVVLPLLETEFVPTGWISKETFLAGYGVTQAVPGPLFTFAAYLGTAMYGWQGGLFATIAIFLPAFLLILGALPFWNTIRQNPKLNGALMGINAAVVGILIAAFYNPVWTSAILEPIDFAFAAVLFSLYTYWKLPPIMIVTLGAISGFFLALL